MTTTCDSLMKVKYLSTLQRVKNLIDLIVSLSMSLPIATVTHRSATWGAAHTRSIDARNKTVHFIVEQYLGSK